MADRGGSTGGMSFGFGGGIGEGGKGVGVGGGIGEGGSGSGDGVGKGGMGCRGNGSTSSNVGGESDSTQQGNAMRSENINWAVTATADKATIMCPDASRPVEAC